MSESLDRYEADRLLPCCYPAKNNPRVNCGSCDRCIKRPAVAAEFRKMGERIEKLEAALKGFVSAMERFGIPKETGWQ